MKNKSRMISEFDIKTYIKYLNLNDYKDNFNYLL